MEESRFLLNVFGTKLNFIASKVLHNHIFTRSDLHIYNKYIFTFT